MHVVNIHVHHHRQVVVIMVVVMNNNNFYFNSINYPELVDFEIDLQLSKLELNKQIGQCLKHNESNSSLSNYDINSIKFPSLKRYRQISHQSVSKKKCWINNFKNNNKLVVCTVKYHNHGKDTFGVPVTVTDMLFSNHILSNNLVIILFVVLMNQLKNMKL